MTKAAYGGHITDMSRLPYNIYSNRTQIGTMINMWSY